MRIDELAGNDITALVALSPTRVLAAAGFSNMLIEIEDDRHRILDTSAVRGEMRSLVREGDAIYGATTIEVFRFEIGIEVFEVETSTVQRGLDRESYSCTPECQPSIQLGDAQKYFSDVGGQSSSRNALATGTPSTVK